MPHASSPVGRLGAAEAALLLLSRFQRLMDDYGAHRRFVMKRRVLKASPSRMRKLAFPESPCSGVRSPANLTTALCPAATGASLGKSAQLSRRRRADSRIGMKSAADGSVFRRQCSFVVTAESAERSLAITRPGISTPK